MMSRRRGVVPAIKRAARLPYTSGKFWRKEEEVPMRLRLQRWSRVPADWSLGISRRP